MFQELFKLKKIFPALVDDEVIDVSEADLSWDCGDAAPVLRHLNVAVSKGDLIAVVGRVGAGKTSLINALLG